MGISFKNSDRSLRGLIREFLLTEDAQAQDLIMTPGDQKYREALQRFPVLDQAFKQLNSMFEEAKKNRISYLENNFRSRFEELNKFLKQSGSGEIVSNQVDLEGLKQSMIDRVRNAKIFYSVYPESLEPNFEVTNGIMGYSQNKDPDSSWRALAGDNSTRAFTNSKVNDIYVRPPSLIFDGIKPVGTQLDVDTGTLEHELMHQEDYAASSFLLGSASAAKKRNPATRDLELPNIMSAGLFEESLIDSQDLTPEFVQKRFESSPTLKRIASDQIFEYVSDLIENDVLQNVAILQFLVNFVSRVGVTSWALVVDNYVNRVLPAFDESNNPIPENQVLRREAFSLAESVESESESVTISSPSHTRITLSLMRPYLESAIQSHGGDFGSIAEEVLTKMEEDDQSETKEASIILLLTDLDKLSNLLLVAKSGNNAGSSQIAERWSKLAGILL